MLKRKQPAHGKGTLGSADILLHKALIQGHTVNSDIFYVANYAVGICLEHWLWNYIFI